MIKKRHLIYLALYVTACIIAYSFFITTALKESIATYPFIKKHIIHEVIQSDFECGFFEIAIKNVKDASETTEILNRFACIYDVSD